MARRRLINGTGRGLKRTGPEIEKMLAWPAKLGKRRQDDLASSLVKSKRHVCVVSSLKESVRSLKGTSCRPADKSLDRKWHLLANFIDGPESSKSIRA